MCVYSWEKLKVSKIFYEIERKGTFISYSAKKKLQTFKNENKPHHHQQQQHTPWLLTGFNDILKEKKIIKLD